MSDSDLGGSEGGGEFGDIGMEVIGELSFGNLRHMGFYV